MRTYCVNTYCASKAILKFQGLTKSGNAFTAALCPLHMSCLLKSHVLYDCTLKLQKPLILQRITIYCWSANRLDASFKRLAAKRGTGFKIHRSQKLKALSNENGFCKSLLFQGHNWITIGVEAEAPVRIDVHQILAHILLLLAKSIAHAITSCANVRECDCS